MRHLGALVAPERRFLFEPRDATLQHLNVCAEALHSTVKRDNLANAHRPKALITTVSPLVVVPVTVQLLVAMAVCVNTTA